MVVRGDQVIFRSPVLQHFFDCPLQFGACPDFSESTDSAEDAAVFELAVQPGDILVAGSDGLWDNCYDSELMGLLPDRPEAVGQVSNNSSCKVDLPADSNLNVLTLLLHLYRGRLPNNKCVGLCIFTLSQL